MTSSHHTKFPAMSRRIFALIFGLSCAFNLYAANIEDHLRLSRSKCEIRSQSEVEQIEREAIEQARSTLNSDAVDVVNETKNALEALNNGLDKDGMLAIERAIVKADVLLARHPEAPLFPVGYEVKIADSLASKNMETIKSIGNSAKTAIDNRKYAAARTLLDALRSEILVQSYHLPIVTYSGSLKNAALLLSQKKPLESRAVLMSSLNSLVVIDQIIPLPLVNAGIKLAAAEEKRDSESRVAIKLLIDTRFELDRALELGYVERDDREYNELRKEIGTLEEQVATRKSRLASFAVLKEKLRLFFKRITESKKQAHNYILQPV